MSRVLVVDDECGIRHIVKLALSRIDMAVLESDSAESALAQFELTPPDVVLMDLRLPDMNGVELCRLIRQRHPTLPVVFMSASTELPQAAQQAGATAYLEKPFKLLQLQEVIRRSLATRLKSADDTETTP